MVIATRTHAFDLEEVVTVSTLTFTFTAGSEGGSSIRAIANAIEKASMAVADRNATGGSLTMVLDNAPSTGVASVLIAGAGLPTQPTFLA